MLGATHTSVLMEIMKRAGCEPCSELMPGGLAMVFGNLLPDNLPMVGVPPESSHNPDCANELATKLPSVGTGVMIHIYTDNLTHCDNILDNGNYGASVALKLGIELMEKTEGKFSGLVERYAGQSTAYTLHTVIELAADVVAARSDVVEAIERSWNAAGEKYPAVLELVSEIYGVKPGILRDGMKKFPPEKRPSREVLYSRSSRAQLFLRKFATPEHDDERRRADTEEIMEMIEAGEKMLSGRLSSIVEDFARRILDAEPALGEKVTELVNSGRSVNEEIEETRQS